MIGVVLARMQPIHKTHEFLIRSSIKDNEKTFVFIGSADKSRTKRNPFTFEERKLLIEKVFEKEIKSEKVELVKLDDLTDEDDEDVKSWGNYLYDSITNAISQKEFSIYYCDEPDIMLSWFTDDLKEKIDFHFFDRNDLFSNLSATRIREALLNDDLDYLRENLPSVVYDERENLKKILQKI